MVMSMTGYGKESFNIEGGQVSIEGRSVNHRFLDISIKLPHNLLFLEDKMKKLVKKQLSRGRIDLFVTIKGQGFFERTVEVDWAKLTQYMEKLEQIQGHFQLTGNVSIDMVTKLEDVFIIQEYHEGQGEWQTTLLAAAREVINQIIIMRRSEGNRLAEDLHKRTDIIENLLTSLRDRRPHVVEEYKEKIRLRIEEYMKELIDPEEPRILQEVALLAEKGDITEELTRMDSHLDQFRKTLSLAEPIGRRLDFIVQEMHREMNTIGSKSNDAMVSEWVISLKSEVEKMKEQVQNVE